jgi:hypothetical protein
VAVFSGFFLFNCSQHFSICLHWRISNHVKQLILDLILYMKFGDVIPYQWFSSDIPKSLPIRPTSNRQTAMGVRSMFLPPPGKFCPPLEKSLRTPIPIAFNQIPLTKVRFLSSQCKFRHIKISTHFGTINRILLTEEKFVPSGRPSLLLISVIIILTIFNQV